MGYDAAEFADYSAYTVRGPNSSTAECQVHSLGEKPLCILIGPDPSSDGYRFDHLQVHYATSQHQTVCVEQHYHHHGPNTPEVYTVLQGEMEIELDDGTTFELCAMQAIVLPPGVFHRMSKVSDDLILYNIKGSEPWIKERLYR